MNIYKNKLPKGYSFPLKTSDFTLYIDKFQIRDVKSIHYWNKTDKPEILTISFRGIPTSLYPIRGQASFYISAVLSQNRSSIREKFLSHGLAFGFDWLKKLQTLPANSTKASRDQSLCFSIKNEKLIHKVEPR